ncbi:MAG: hypothetical protein ACREN1_00220 [Candidatus Dormibacteria bacterium]
MSSQPATASIWDRPRWPPQAAWVASAAAPVLVATGVSAHAGSVPVAQSVAAFCLAVLVGLGGAELRTAATAPNPQVRWSRMPPLGAALPLAVAAGLGVWLAAATAWWLLAPGALGGGLLLGLISYSTRGVLPLPTELAAVAAAELLAGWGTVAVELGRLPWLGLVAAIMPASLACSLWILARPATSSAGAGGAPGASLTRGSQTTFQGLLMVALAVPLLTTLPGWDGAECFLPWLLAPLGEGPLRNSRSPDDRGRRRALRQMTVLLLGASVLLAVGVWAG